jgi:hypothetical protein
MAIAALQRNDGVLEGDVPAAPMHDNGDDCSFARFDARVAPSAGKLTPCNIPIRQEQRLRTSLPLVAELLSAMVQY